MAYVDVVGKRLSELRAQRGISGKDLSEKSGVKRTVIVNLENGRKQQVTVEELFRLASALGVSPLLLVVDPADPFGPLLGIESLGVRNAEVVKWSSEAFQSGSYSFALLQAAKILSGIPSESALIEEGKVDLATRGVKGLEEMTQRRIDSAAEMIGPSLAELEEVGVPVPPLEDLLPSAADVVRQVLE